MERASIGQRVKEALILRGMSQSDLCSRTGLSSAQISSYISGRYNPRPENLSLIATSLRVSEVWLNGYDVDYSVIPPNIDELVPNISAWLRRYGADIQPVNEEDPTWSVTFQGFDLGDSLFPTIVDIYRQKEYLSEADTSERLNRLLSGALRKVAQRACDTPARRIKGVRIPVLGSIVAGTPLEAVELRDEDDWEEIHPDLAATGDFFALRVKGSSMEPRIAEGDVVIVRQQPDVDSGSLAVIMINGNEATLKKVTKHENGIMLTATNVSVYEPHFYSAEEVESLPVQVIGKVVELRAKFE